MQKIPSYAELPILDSTGERHSWEVFGPQDEFGTLNFLNAKCVVEAARLIETGEVLSLDIPLGEPQPQFWAMRPPLKHNVRTHRHGRDDHLDEFNLQGSTQWDGLRHVRFRQYGYYGGHDEQKLETSGVLGMDRWAEKGIIGRAVLVDVAGHFERTGKPLDATRELAIDVALFNEILAEQKVTLQEGDVLLVRTGWLRWYTALTMAQREEIVDAYKADRATFKAPGVDASLATVGWLWDSRIAAIATDTPTFEALPYNPDRGWAHHRMLALLGMPLGELWALDQLAERCRLNGRYAFFLSSAPLKLRKGVGTPANAYAIF